MTEAAGQEYSFRGQRPDENVILVTKQHIWLLMPVVVVWLLLIAAVAALIWWFGFSATSSMAMVVAALMGGFYSFYIWYTWNSSDYIVTSERVIKIDQVSLISRVISEAEIDRIQEISTEIHGPVRTLLNFGTVRIQTASTTGRMDLDDLSDPYSVQQVIVGIQKKLDRTAAKGPRLL